MAISLCLGLGGIPAGVRAQQPAAGHPPSGVAKKAHIRFWNLLPYGPANNLLLTAGGQLPLAASAPGNIYTDYLPALAGSYTMVVRRTGTPGTVLGQLPAVVPEKGFFTVLASEKNGRPTVEVFDDTPDPRVQELVGRLVVRQFCPGTQVKVSIAAGTSSQILEYGSTATLEDVSISGPVNISVQATRATTPPTTQTWTLPGDFSKAHHATLLLVADTYGRVLMQLCYDAQLRGAVPPPAQ